MSGKEDTKLNIQVNYGNRKRGQQSYCKQDQQKKINSPPIYQEQPIRTRNFLKKISFIIITNLAKKVQHSFI